MCVMYLNVGVCVFVCAYVRACVSVCACVHRCLCVIGSNSKRLLASVCVCVCAWSRVHGLLFLHAASTNVDCFSSMSTKPPLIPISFLSA